MFSVWMGESHAHLADLTYMQSKSACDEHFWLSPTAGVGTRNLEWKLRKTWLPLQLHKQGVVITKDAWQP